MRPLGLTDGQGRGCILTAPTTQWQCDVGATPQGGFSVGCDGTLSYKGNSKFDSCPTGDNGGFNIYSTQPANQQGCVQITLTTDSCKSGCPPPPPPPPPAKPTAKACPADLTGNWEVRTSTWAVYFNTCLIVNTCATTVPSPHRPSRFKPA